MNRTHDGHRTSFEVVYGIYIYGVCVMCAVDCGVRWYNIYYNMLCTHSFGRINLYSWQCNLDLILRSGLRPSLQYLYKVLYTLQRSTVRCTKEIQWEKVSCSIRYIYMYIYIYISGFHSSYPPGVFYTYLCFYNHAHRLGLEKLLYIELSIVFFIMQ